MEFISHTLGLEEILIASSGGSATAASPLSLGGHRIRCYVMKRRTRSRAAMEDVENNTTLLPPSCSFVLEDIPSSPILSSRYKYSSLKYKRVKDDDETLETVNTFEDEHSFSVSNDNASVSFANPLVTEIHYRPLVETAEEKALLFYNDQDYQLFRQDFCAKQRLLRMQRYSTSKQLSSLSTSSEETEDTTASKRVQFSRDVVTDVFVYSCAAAKAEKDLLFYSEHDLQRFLEEFVSSLNGVLTDCRA